MSSMRRAVATAAVLATVAAACGDDSTPGDTAATGTTTGEAALQEAERWPPPAPTPDQTGVYDPVAAGEPLPDGFRQVLRRDRIAPVYDPTFVPADQAGWRDESLVIGVFLEGEARAYPVGFLNRREMVIDNHRGIPTLVTW